jgi:hypothetical protein
MALAGLAPVRALASGNDQDVWAAALSSRHRGDRLIVLWPKECAGPGECILKDGGLGRWTSDARLRSRSKHCLWGCRRVLRFVASLAGSAPKGEHGAAMRQFASSLDAVSARQMTQAIEEGCERADAGGRQVFARHQHRHRPAGGRRHCAVHSGPAESLTDPGHIKRGTHTRFPAL